MTAATPAPGLLRDAFDTVTGDEDARVCTDIPDAACREQPRAFFLTALTLVFTKTADGLMNPKIVLPWLLGAAGAPAAFAGLVVPLREALALLPQLAVAGAIRRVAVRKWFYVGGALAQAAALALLALGAATLTGAAAGWAVVAALAAFALARGVCSVALKDVLGKTVAKTRRGKAGGYADSVAGIVVATLGLGLIALGGDAPVAVYAGLVAAAAGLWIAAAGAYALIPEQPGATAGGGSALDEARRNLRLLRDDPALRTFIAARALLAGTALMAPFVTALAQAAGGSLRDFGALVLAGALASAASSAVWGWFADVSSRRVMALAGGVGAGAGALAVALGLLGAADAAPGAVAAGLLFVLGIAHAGVRQGRKTYVVDLADADTRATYVALANTLIGIVLIAGGAIGLVADLGGPEAAIAACAFLAAAGALLALKLPEAQTSQP